MHDHLWRELEEDELEQAQGESKAGPVGSVLENLETVAIELDLALEVHVVESLHWDLAPSTVLQLVGLALKSEVVLDWASWELGLLILARAHAGHDKPEGDEDWDGGEDGKEDGGFQTTADLPCSVCWDEKQQRQKDDV